MEATFLIDNTSDGQLACEWGFSLFIEHAGLRILADFGASDAFTRNAQALGIDLSRVNIAWLSHAHYDHANGLLAFFALNDHAPCFISANTQANCWSLKEAEPEYIGVPMGMLDAWGERLVRVTSMRRIVPSVWVLPHSTPFDERVSHADYMRLKSEDGDFIPDDFAHEQSLVFECASGLVVISSCSHIGPDAILREVQEAFPGRRIAAIVGGFHLYRTPDDEVRAIAGRLRELGVEQVITGHCTGDRALAILQEELGDTVIATHSGLHFHVD